MRGPWDRDRGDRCADGAHSAKGDSILCDRVPPGSENYRAYSPETGFFRSRGAGRSAEVLPGGRALGHIDCEPEF